MTVLRFAAALAAISVGLAIALHARGTIWSSDAAAVKDAVRDFAAEIAQHREAQGYLPGDINRDGEIDSIEAGYVAAHLARTGLIRAGATEVSVAVAGRSVNLRAISRRASAVRGFAWDVNNVVEVPGLPCHIVAELDARNDDGNFATGNIRASVAACVPGGLNDPVGVVAVAMRP